MLLTIQSPADSTNQEVIEIPDQIVASIEGLDNETTTITASLEDFQLMLRYLTGCPDLEASSANLFDNTPYDDEFSLGNLDIDKATRGSKLADTLSCRAYQWVCCRFVAKSLRGLSPDQMLARFHAVAN
jgi:hypothetical protein